MKTIAASLLATITASIVLATPAHADGGRQEVCVEGPTGWYAFAIETDADREAIAGLRVEPLPNSVAGCAAYGPLAPAPVIPPPVDVPDCEPVTRIVTVPGPERIVRVEVPGPERIVEHTTVLEVRDPAQAATIAKQARKIRRLQARIARLQGR